MAATLGVSLRYGMWGAEGQEPGCTTVACLIWLGLGSLFSNAFLRVYHYHEVLVGKKSTMWPIALQVSYEASHGVHQCCRSGGRPSSSGRQRGVSGLRRPQASAPYEMLLVLESTQQSTTPLCLMQLILDMFASTVNGKKKPFLWIPQQLEFL